MIISKTFTRTLLLIGAIGALTCTAFAGSNTGPLRVGTNAAFAPPLEAAVEVAKSQGLDVKLIEFTDPVTPEHLAGGW